MIEFNEFHNENVVKHPYLSPKMHSNSQILMNSKIKMQSIAYMDGFRTQGVVAEPFFVLLFFGAGKKGEGGDEN